MTPGVAGVDAPRERRELRFDALEVGHGLVVHPGRPFADGHALVRAPGRGQVGVGVARFEGQPELAGELPVGAHPLGDHLAAPLQRPAVGKELLLDPPARTLTRLEHDDVRAGRSEVARSGQAGQPGADDDHVMHGPLNRRSGEEGRPTGGSIAGF
jgi:hypothetical protein